LVATKQSGRKSRPQRRVAYTSEVPDELVVGLGARRCDVQLAARIETRNVQTLVLDDDVAQLELRQTTHDGRGYSQLVVGVRVPRC